MRCIEENVEVCMCGNTVFGVASGGDSSGKCVCVCVCVGGG